MGKTILRVVVSSALLGYLFFSIRDTLPDIAEKLKNIDRPLLGLCVLVFLFAVLVMAKRLQLIFEAEDARLSFQDSVNLTFVGYFFNNFIPTAVGGDIVKAMCASRVTGQGMKSVTSVLMDRIFGLFTFIIIPSLSILFLSKTQGRLIPVIIYGFLAASILCFFFLFNRSLARRARFLETLLNRFRLGDKARRIYDGLHNFKNHKGVVAQAMALSILGQSLSILVIYGLAKALGAETGIVNFFIAVPIVHLISMVPVSIGGIGVRENAYKIFLTPYIGEPNAVAVGILWLGLLLLLSVIGGVIYLVRHDYHPRLGEPAVS